MDADEHVRMAVFRHIHPCLQFFGIGGIGPVHIHVRGPGHIDNGTLLLQQSLHLLGDGQRHVLFKGPCAQSVGPGIRAAVAGIQGDPFASDAAHYGIGIAEPGSAGLGPGRAAGPFGILRRERFLRRCRDHVHHHSGGTFGNPVFLQAEHIEHSLLQGFLHIHMDHCGIDLPFQIHPGYIGGILGRGHPGNGGLQVAVHGNPQFIVQHLRLIFRRLVGIQDDPQPSIGIDTVDHILDFRRCLGVARSQTRHQTENK